MSLGQKINKSLSTNILLKDIYLQLNFNWNSLELMYLEKINDKKFDTNKVIYVNTIQKIIINKIS